MSFMNILTEPASAPSMRFNIKGTTKSLLIVALLLTLLIGGSSANTNHDISTYSAPTSSWWQQIIDALNEMYNVVMDVCWFQPQGRQVYMLDSVAHSAKVDDRDIRFEELAIEDNNSFGAQQELSCSAALNPLVYCAELFPETDWFCVKEAIMADGLLGCMEPNLTVYSSWDPIMQPFTARTTDEYTNEPAFALTVDCMTVFSWVTLVTCVMIAGILAHALVVAHRMSLELASATEANAQLCDCLAQQLEELKAKIIENRTALNFLNANNQRDHQCMMEMESRLARAESRIKELEQLIHETKVAWTDAEQDAKAATCLLKTAAGKEACNLEAYRIASHIEKLRITESLARLELEMFVLQEERDAQRQKNISLTETITKLEAANFELASQVRVAVNAGEMRASTEVAVQLHEIIKEQSLEATSSPAEPKDQPDEAEDEMLLPFSLVELIRTCPPLAMHCKEIPAATQEHGEIIVEVLANDEEKEPNNQTPKEGAEKPAEKELPITQAIAEGERSDPLPPRTEPTTKLTTKPTTKPTELTMEPTEQTEPPKLTTEPTREDLLLMDSRGLRAYLKANGRNSHGDHAATQLKALEIYDAKFAQKVTDEVKQAPAPLPPKTRSYASVASASVALRPASSASFPSSASPVSSASTTSSASPTGSARSANSANFASRTSAAKPASRTNAAKPTSSAKYASPAKSPSSAKPAGSVKSPSSAKSASSVKSASPASSNIYTCLPVEQAIPKRR